LKITIITVCYNAEKTIERTIQSVLNQDYQNIEYIIVDGLSKDSTMEIVLKYSNRIARIFSEHDLGMYDAINKGIKSSTGNIIGILNADDFFSNNYVISKIANKFKSNIKLDAIYGDVTFIDESDKIKRRYSSSIWKPNRFIFGLMPAHPTFYCKKNLFYDLGFYKLNFKIAADFELLIRFFKKNKLNYLYIPESLVNMKLGGKSTSGLKSTILLNKEILYACKINNLKTNFFMIYLKYVYKIFEYIQK